MIEEEYKSYGVLYAKVSLKRDDKLYWLKHCAITSLLPTVLKTEIKLLSDRINLKYKEHLVVPMDNRITPGCTTKPDKIKEVATDIYNGLSEIFKRIYNKENCIRLVYGIGELPSEWIENKVETTHEVGNFPIMVKVGRTLDKVDTPGMYEVSI